MGPPAVGREVIAKEAEAFMTSDRILDRVAPENAFESAATNFGVDNDGLIRESKGNFDSVEYKRQFQFGVEE